jgi:hypothetical protein
MPRLPTAVAPSETGSAHEILERLRDVVRQITLLEARKLALIAEAQAGGASWDQVGGALEVSRQAAWEKYRGHARETMDRPGAAATQSESELLASAAEVLAEVRRRRRGA